MIKTSDQNDDAMWDAFNRFHYLCDTHRFMKIFTRAELVRMVADVPGDIVDAGAFKGASTLEFAHAIEAYRPNSTARVVSFDTFEATFPRVRDDEQASAVDHMSKFDPTAFALLTETIERNQMQNRIELVQGDITDSLPAYLEARPGFRICLLHCDLDVYPATLSTLRAAWPRVVPGGIVVFDEYAVDKWGEADAVDEFLSGLEQPPLLKTLPGSPTPTAYCVKQHY